MCLLSLSNHSIGFANLLQGRYSALALYVWIFFLKITEFDFRNDLTNYCWNILAIAELQKKKKKLSVNSIISAITLHVFSDDTSIIFSAVALFEFSLC